MVSSGASRDDRPGAAGAAGHGSAHGTGAAAGIGAARQRARPLADREPAATAVRADSPGFGRPAAELARAACSADRAGRVFQWTLRTDSTLPIVPVPAAAVPSDGVELTVEDRQGHSTLSRRSARIARYH